MSRFNPALMQVAREARGLTQTSLARLVKISQPYLCQIEAGLRVPSEETLASIAHHTGARDQAQQHQNPRRSREHRAIGI